jgi:SAM-dependent methyltransferase
MRADGPEQLLQAMITSKEYLSKLNNRTRGSVPVNVCRKLDVESHCSAVELEKMMAHIRRNWSMLGDEEPYWSVLALENFKKRNMGKDLESFYATGQMDVSNLKLFYERNSILTSRPLRCLEYGCGVGRVTRWLAEAFDEVVAYDISPKHLRIAREYLHRKEIKNVAFKPVTSLEDLNHLETADLIYTVIVLQHNPPPIIQWVLKSLLNALKKGGAALFQLPTFQANYQFRVCDYLKKLENNGGMEMHILPQNEVFRVVEEAHCRVLEVVSDDWSGEGFDSHTFFVQKK